MPVDACASVGQVPGAREAKYGVVVQGALVDASGSTVQVVYVICTVSDDACASVCTEASVRKCFSVHASTVLSTVWSVHLSTCVGDTYMGNVLAVTGSTSGVLSPRVSLSLGEQSAKYVVDVCASVAVSAGSTEV